MKEFELHTLGSLWARRAGEEEAVFQGGNACILLSVLASMPGQWVGRDQLAQLVWPSGTNGHRRHSLRQLLSTIRRKLSADALEETNAGLRLPADRWWVDLVEFERAVQEDRCADAALLYQGPFGGNTELSEGSELRALIDSLQARLQIQAGDCLNRLVSQALEVGDLIDAESWARRFVTVDPVSEDARRLLIETLQADNRPADALGVFEEYRVYLSELIGDGPSDDLCALAETIRRSAEEERPSRERPSPGRPSARPVIDPPRPAAPGAVKRWGFRAGMLAVFAVFAVVVAAVIRGRPGEPDPPGGFSFMATALDQFGGLTAREVDLMPSGVSVREVPAPLGFPDPTGRYLAVGRLGRNGYDLEVLLTEDASAVVRRTNSVDETPLAWAPDGRSLLYKATILSPGNTRSVERFGIVSLPDGELEPFGTLEPELVQGASWSPLGTAVVLSGSLDSDLDLFLLSPQGDLRTQVRMPGQQSWPVWSPSGEWIAFESEQDGKEDVLILAASDSIPLPVASGPRRQRSPLWLADTLLAFLQGDGTETELRLINPFSGEESRAIETGVRLATLNRHHLPSDPVPWVESIQATPREILMSVNEERSVDLEVRDAVGNAVDLPTGSFTWEISDLEIADLAEDRRVLGRKPGRGVITGSLQGWREVEIPVAVVPLEEVEAPVVVAEDWANGIQADRWIEFGHPSPVTRAAGFPSGGGVFKNNGDGNHNSGVISMDPLDLSEGLTVEFWASVPMDGQNFQDILVALDRSPAVDASGEIVNQSCLAWFRTNGYFGLAYVRVGETEPMEFPLPDEVEAWHRYALQVEPSGLVTMVIDGEPLWRGRSRHGFSIPHAAHLVLGGRTVNTEILLGPVTVYRGAKYRPSLDD